MLIADATRDDLEAVRGLFRAYAAWLAIALCFQGFDDELRDLPGRYVPPGGGLWLAWRAGEPVGVVALRALEDRTAELKRLYVVPEARGLGLAAALSERALERARQAGYRYVVLDTFPERMPAATALYARLGFCEVPAYYANPHDGVRYYRLALTPP